MIVYILSVLLIPFTNGIGFEIPPGGRNCFYEAATEGSPLKVIYQVTNGGNLDVTVQITGPDGRILYQGEDETTGKFTFNAHTTGLFSFCFGNQMSRVTGKTMQLEITTGIPVVDDSASSVLKTQIKNLQQATAAIAVDYQYLKQREIMHLSTNENTNSIVFYWSFVEIIVLVSMGFFQIYYLKRYFENSRSV